MYYMFLVYAFKFLYFFPFLLFINLLFSGMKLCFSFAAHLSQSSIESLVILILHQLSVIKDVTERVPHLWEDKRIR